MKYLKAIYRYLCRTNEIFLEALDKGLELKIGDSGEFFYNPSTGKYDDTLRERLLEKRESHIEEISTFMKDKNFSRRKYARESFLAQKLFLFCHPVRVFKEVLLKL